MANKIKSKIIFIGMIILFTATLVGFSLKLNEILTPISNPLNYSFVEYNLNKHNSCYISISEPTILLRLDDVRAYSIPSPYVIDETLKNNISITLGVIPKNLDKDERMVYYLRKVKNNSLIEIAQHGFSHKESDNNMTLEDINNGNIIIQKTLGVFPVTYIPPFNEILNSTRHLLESRFLLISSGQNVIKEGKVAELGQTTETYNYEGGVEISEKDILSKCYDNLNRYNFCVIAIHPQEFTTYFPEPNNDINLNKLEEYGLFLNNLKQLNATFKTFKDVVECRD